MHGIPLKQFVSIVNISSIFRKIHQQRDVKIIKKNMGLKLDLVQEQLSGTKFGQIAGRGNSIQTEQQKTMKNNIAKPKNMFVVSDSEEEEPFIPVMRKAISEFDPELMKREEKQLKKKRLELEKSEKELEFFLDFNEEERKELDKLDRLTKTYLFLRKKITNPIIS